MRNPKYSKEHIDSMMREGSVGSYILKGEEFIIDYLKEENLWMFTHSRFKMKRYGKTVEEARKQIEDDFDKVFNK